MGFGLWENLDPNAPKKMRRPKPPPPPPKAEPIWYNCTVIADWSRMSDPWLLKLLVWCRWQLAPGPTPRSWMTWSPLTSTPTWSPGYNQLTDINVVNHFWYFYVSRDEWVSGGSSDLMEDREEPGQMFDKEDMSDMFSRAMLEKMQPEGMLLMLY